MPKPPFPHHTVTHQHPPYLPNSVIIVPTLKYSFFLQCIFEFSVKKTENQTCKRPYCQCYLSWNFAPWDPTL